MSKFWEPQVKLLALEVAWPCSVQVKVIQPQPWAGFSAVVLQMLPQLEQGLLIQSRMLSEPMEEHMSAVELIHWAAQTVKEWP